MTLSKKLLSILCILFLAVCLSACASSQVKDDARNGTGTTVYGGSGQGGFGESDLNDGSNGMYGSGSYNAEGWGDFTGPEARQKFINEDIYFMFDSTAISPEGRQALDMKAKWMQVNPGVTVIIEGHCDNRGTAEYNLALGEARAIAVKNYMVALGIGSNRMEVVSYGEERPLVDGDGEAAWSKNRRAHFAFPQ